MDAEVLRLTQEALWLVLLLSAPAIFAASIIGLLVALLQAATQIQEQTLSYTVRFVVIVVTLFITATLLGGTLYNFSDRIFLNFPNMVS